MKKCTVSTLPLLMTFALSREVECFSHLRTVSGGRTEVIERYWVASRYEYEYEYAHDNRMRLQAYRDKEEEIKNLSADNDVHNYDQNHWTRYQREYRNYAYTKEFENHGIVYIRKAIPGNEFQELQRELSSLSLNLVKETTSSVAINRVGAQIPFPSKIHDIFSDPNGVFMKLINDIHKSQSCDNANDETYPSTSHKNMILSHSVPMELRVYETRGAGMEWHFDDILYSPEQTEVVFTVENNSDCVTVWEEGNKSEKNNDIEMKQVETEANSAIILKAGPKGARHRVSPLKNGRRVILKLVYVREDAVFLDGAEKHLKQFESRRKKRKKR